MEAPSTAADTVRSEVLAMMGRSRMNQTRLGQIIGVSQSQVSERLNGRKDFTIHELELLAGHWDVPITHFFADKAGAVPRINEAGGVEYPAVTRNLPAAMTVGSFRPGDDDKPGIN